MNYIFQEVRAPKNFKEYIFASQYAQAEGIKYGTYHFRSMKPRCMGALYWQIVDCFPGTSWSGIDYEYRLKVLHYYARRFFSQVVLCVKEDRFEPRRLEIFVVNDHPEGFTANLIWALRDSAGCVVKEGKKEIQIQGSSSFCLSGDGLDRGNQGGGQEAVLSGIFVMQSGWEKNQ